jgi:hypothetical protein
LGGLRGAAKLCDNRLGGERQQRCFVETDILLDGQHELVVDLLGEGRARAMLSG